MSSDEDFEVHSGASECTPQEAGKIRKGAFLVIRGRACKVVDISKAQVGKHGSAKCHFVGMDLFSSKKVEMVCPASAIVSQPNVSRTEYQLGGLNEEHLSLFNLTTSVMRHDIKLPRDESLRGRIEEAIRRGEASDSIILVFKALGFEEVCEIKSGLSSAGAAYRHCDNKKNNRKKK